MTFLAGSARSRRCFRPGLAAAGIFNAACAAKACVGAETSSKAANIKMKLAVVILRGADEFWADILVPYF